jgi:signal transduction histidine kinase
VAAANAGVNLQVEVEPGLPSLELDRERILNALINFLTNAIKYSPHDGLITLRARKHDQGVYFSVSDQGPGVPQQYQSRIFERFFRVPGTRKKGIGLGLSIVRDFVRAHHGRVGVASEPGQGSEFFFILPTATRNEISPNS